MYMQFLVLTYKGKFKPAYKSLLLCLGAGRQGKCFVSKAKQIIRSKFLLHWEETTVFLPPQIVNFI